MRGFFGELLRIDLSTQTFRTEEISDELLGKTLGGKGLGTHLLTTENPQGVDPFSPESVFIIATGPVTGTKLWAGSRFGVYAKSPATGGYGESYCGGKLSAKIKGCGIDAIIITGRSETLTSLTITSGGVLFNNAEFLKGKDSFTTEEHILKHAPETSSAMVIGPAGESGVAFACIKADRWRSLGRCGMGAVLGSKNVKGIAFAGDRRCLIANEMLLKQINKDIAKKGSESPGTRLYQQLGTPMQVAVMNSKQCFPTRYWKAGFFPKWENLSADYMRANFDVTSRACPNCFLKCTKHCRITKGRHKGLELEGPEYETIYALGGLNELDALEEVAWLNDLCDRLGIDTMSAGNIAGFAVEAWKARKTDFEIDYNQPDRIAQLFKMIARREGLGDVLAKGIKKAAAELGLEDIAIHVKGLEPAGFDPRVLKGMALSYAISARGACHLRGTFYKPELTGEADLPDIADKAKLLVNYEDRAALFDSLILCRFFRDFILWDELQQIVEATTGLELSKSDLEIIANRITQQTRAYNTREGLDASTDRLPPRFLKEATAEGARLEAKDLEKMIESYNAIREGRTS